MLVVILSLHLTVSSETLLEMKAVADLRAESQRKDIRRNTNYSFFG